MRSRILSIVCGVFPLFFLSIGGLAQDSADLVLYNGKVLTVDSNFRTALTCPHERVHPLS